MKKSNHYYLAVGMLLMLYLWHCILSMLIFFWLRPLNENLFGIVVLVSAIPMTFYTIYKIMTEDENHGK